MVFVSPQYYVVYEDQFMLIPNSASYGFFTDNSFNAYSLYKFIISDIDCYIIPEGFYASEQHHGRWINISWITSDEGYGTTPPATALEG